MFEYAISEGEGTLVAYGTLNEASDVDIILEPMRSGLTVIVERCADDCETGS